MGVHRAVEKKIEKPDPPPGGSFSFKLLCRLAIYEVFILHLPLLLLLMLMVPFVNVFLDLDIDQA